MMTDSSAFSSFSSSDLYSRQMKWREDAKKKALETHTTKKEDPELTFQPKKFTKAQQKKFNDATGGLDKGISSHVVRQAKARQIKASSEEAINTQSPIKVYSNLTVKTSSLLPVEATREHNNINSSMNSNNANKLLSQSVEKQQREELDVNDSDLEERNGTSLAFGSMQEANKSLQAGDELDDFPDETVVEMLERERREWQSDRVKLIHCIHLQQLELTQRAIASHEKATDIAKEFARAIEGFEERLVSVENNVHKEISAIKSIAESLLVSSSSNKAASHKEDKDLKNTLLLETRVQNLESCMEGILDRLDNIASSLSSANRHNNA